MSVELEVVEGVEDGRVTRRVQLVISHAAGALVMYLLGDEAVDFGMAVAAEGRKAKAGLTVVEGPAAAEVLSKGQLEKIIKNGHGKIRANPEGLN